VSVVHQIDPLVAGGQVALLLRPFISRIVSASPADRPRLLGLVLIDALPELRRPQAGLASVSKEYRNWIVHLPYFGMSLLVRVRPQPLLVVQRDPWQSI